MGVCTRFHQTWTPGFNSEYVDPNLAYSFQRKLHLAKKVAWWMFVVTILACLILLLVKVCQTHVPECPGNVTASDTTAFSQAIAESQSQTLALTNSTERVGMELDLDPVTTSPTNVNLINDSETHTVKHHTLPENTVPANEHTFVLNETSTERIYFPAPTAEVPKVETTTGLYLTTEETTVKEKQKDFMEFLNGQLNSSEKDEISVKRNMTTRDESSTNRAYSDGSCRETDFRCKLSQKCIPLSQKCDGRLDCSEMSVSNTTGRIEANVDRSDEMGCDCRPESFFCDKSATNQTECIHMNLVCDSLNDCSNKKDEAVCTTVSRDLTKVSAIDKRRPEIDGYVLVRVRGSWHPYCLKEWSTDMGRKICKFLGYRKLVTLQTIVLSDLNLRIGVNLTGRVGTSEEVERTEKSTHWVLDRSEDYMAVTGGPIENVVTEASGDDEHDCTVGHIICSNVNTSN